MHQVKRLSIALSIILAGAILVPFISLPAQAFTWQLFADAYVDQPMLSVSHTSGQPGSYFQVKGKNYPPDTTVTISVNGTTLGTVMSDDDGEFEFELDTVTQTAGEGAYYVTATVNPSATVSFTLDSSSPDLWPSVGALTTFEVPAGIAFTEILYLPIIFRQ